MTTQAMERARPPQPNRAGQFEYTPRKADNAEMAVIGAIVQSEKAFNQVAAIVDSTHFYNPVNRAIFEAVREQQRAGREINVLDLLASFDGRLHGMTRNGLYLQECIAEIPTPANGAHYARQVLAAAHLREAAEHAVYTMQLTATTALDDVANAMELIRKSAEKLGKGGGAKPSWMDWDHIAQAVADELERLQEGEDEEAAGVPTGWRDLDRLLTPLKPGQVVVIAGRPGSGKTVAGLNIAQHVAMRLRQAVVMFSLEMSALECGMRLMSAGSRVPLHVLREGALSDDDWTKVARYMGETGEAPLFVDDTPNISMAHAEAQMLRLEAMGVKPKVVVFDYLQLIQPAGQAWSRQEQVAQISRDMKLFAKKWGVAVVLLAQLNRGPEQRTEKIPMLSDLRESGAVEQDADIVILLYRPDYYDKESPRAGEVDFIVAKHRGGATDTITMAAQLHLSRFMDMAEL